ncbi:hypothetical protein TorRG33x02_097560 [Trema orientale]|uniref:Uncharacterized protein n=1 Tax=Trema orientale TaxID=63057 RepID=A0A2P5F9P3_TREOI|nr:hypothetical protein TorRG33x02_097560 [Trema orientale]
MGAKRTRVTGGVIEEKLLRECQCVSRSGLVGILVATRLAGKIRAFSLWEALLITLHNTDDTCLNTVPRAIHSWSTQQIEN